LDPRKNIEPYGVWGDPCIITDGNGRVYYFHLSDPEGTNWSSDQILDRMVCQTKDGPGARLPTALLLPLMEKNTIKNGLPFIQPRALLH
jgi:hypothetical protein